MPILKREPSMFPANLMQASQLLTDVDRQWFCIYTISRREKDLMRRLAAMEIAHFGPMIPKRFRSPSGRLRTSFVPMFPNYVFMLGNEEERGRALTTNCISSFVIVEDREQLVKDLKQISQIITADVPLTPEAKLESGNLVRVKSGPFTGYEGLVIRREGNTRLLLSIRFLEQGVSMELDEALLEVVD